MTRSQEVALVVLNGSGSGVEVSCDRLIKLGLVAVVEHEQPVLVGHLNLDEQERRLLRQLRKRRNLI